MIFFSSVIFIIYLDFDLRIDKEFFYITCERHYGHFKHFFEAHLISLKLKQNKQFENDQKLQKLLVKHYSWPFCSETIIWACKVNFRNFLIVLITVPELINFSCLYNNLEIFVIQPRGSPEMLNIGQNELSENVRVNFLNCLTLRRTKVYNDSFQSPSKNDQNLFF